MWLVPALGVMVPIVAIIMGIGIGMLRLWLDYRNRRDMFQMHHAERMAAIEKGIELPPLPPQFFQEYRRGAPSSTGSLASGLVLVFVGAAIYFALYSAAGPDIAPWGLVPAAIGAALLLYYALVGRKLRAPRSGPSARPPGGLPGIAEGDNFEP
jgi:Domain of unknown function (DUF6249)